MKPSLRHVRRLALALGLAAPLLVGCVGTGGYADDGYGTADYGVYSAGFGGWEPGYGVGPYHDDRIRTENASQFDHHWSGSHSDHIPSIAGHGGGGFHGGGHGGGGHGGGGGGGGGGHGK